MEPATLQRTGNGSWPKRQLRIFSLSSNKKRLFTVESYLFIRAELGQDGRYHITDESSSGKVAVKQIYKEDVQRHINSGREMFEDPLEEVAIMLSLGQVQPVIKM